MLWALKSQAVWPVFVMLDNVRHRRKKQPGVQIRAATFTGRLLVSGSFTLQALRPFLPAHIG